MSSLYAVEDPDTTRRAVSCDCLAHRHGNAGDRPARQRVYPTDLTDAQWAAIAPMIPVPAWMGGRGGRPEGYCHREMIDAVSYLVDNGTKWRALPIDFPDWSAVYRFFRRWRDQGLLAASCGNFLADSAMTEWETLLTGRSTEAHEDAEWPRVLADDGPDSGIQVFAVSPELQNALAAADRETLAEVARQWAHQYSEDYGGSFEPDTAAEILYELSELARSANVQERALYCWMC